MWLGALEVEPIVRDRLQLETVENQLSVIESFAFTTFGRNEINGLGQTVLLLFKQMRSYWLFLKLLADYIHGHTAGVSDADALASIINNLEYIKAPKPHHLGAFFCI